MLGKVNIGTVEFNGDMVKMEAGVDANGSIVLRFGRDKFPYSVILIPDGAASLRLMLFLSWARAGLPYQELMHGGRRKDEDQGSTDGGPESGQA